MAFLDQTKPAAVPQRGAVPSPNTPISAASRKAPAAAPKKTIAEMKDESFRWAEKLYSQMEQSLIGLSSPDFVRRLHVNAMNAISKYEGDDMLLALQDIDGRKSFKQAILDSAEMNLQINNSEGCLVVYKGKFRFQPMWQGLVEIAYRSGVVKALLKGCYREKDDFEWDMGRIVHHRVDFRMSDRGNVVGYWARAILESGETIDEFKTKEDVEKVRKASNCPNSPAWREWYDEMAYKTVFRSLCKRLPKTEALIKVIANWDSDFSFDSKNTAEEATVTPRKNAFMNAVQAEVTDVETEPTQAQVQAPAEEPSNQGELIND